MSCLVLSPQHLALSLVLSAGPRANLGLLPAQPAPLAAPDPAPQHSPASPSSVLTLSPAQPSGAHPCRESRIPPARPIRAQRGGREGARGFGFWGSGFGLRGSDRRAPSGRCRPPTGGRFGSLHPNPSRSSRELENNTPCSQTTSRMEKLPAKPVL